MSNPLTIEERIGIAADFNADRIKIIRELMEEEAVRFANFVGNRPLPEYSESTNKWRWWSNKKRGYEFATTEQLYQQSKT